MPRPHKGGYLDYGPKTIAERPAAAIAFASVVAEWAYIEDDITKLYAFLMSRWTDQKPIPKILPTHPVAVLTFDTLQTLNQRLNLLDALAKWALEATEAADVHAAIRKIRDRAKERNRVAHGLWGIAPDLNDLTRRLLVHIAANGWRVPEPYEQPPRNLLG